MSALDSGNTCKPDLCLQLSLKVSWKDYFQQWTGLVWERLFATMDYSWKDYLQQWIIIGKIVFNNGLFLERLFSTMHYTCELTNPR